ncbi:hypothetical protein EV363DRAFT_1226173 [Boletus edulis]|nr:hypothetical protein EV363DRAFT_1226173 [Boletus edulis]
MRRHVTMYFCLGRMFKGALLSPSKTYPMFRCKLFVTENQILIGGTADSRISDSKSHPRQALYYVLIPQFVIITFLLYCFRDWGSSFASDSHQEWNSVP